MALSTRLDAGPWLWSPGLDLAAFAGSAAVAVLLVALGHASGLSTEATLPAWAFLAFVVCVDVAHVWSTLLRTYLDEDELRARPGLYALVPVACWGVGVALHALGRAVFWRALAYLAVLHFVRQQVGWVAIYRARAGERSRLDRVLDDAAIYAATGYPLLAWHARMPRAFDWFVAGDFVSLPSLGAHLPQLRAMAVAVLVAFAVRQAHRALVLRRVDVGKCVVVATTALTWWLGIVATDSDFDFTVANVLVHGVPYVVLLVAYARERAVEAPGTRASRLLAHGVGAVLAALVALAFAEECVWDRLVWHDHAELFGGEGSTFALGRVAAALVVPLLALPQATHYVLDAFLWRRGATTPAQARAMGFARAPAARSRVDARGAVT